MLLTKTKIIGYYRVSIFSLRFLSKLIGRTIWCHILVCIWIHFVDFFFFFFVVGGGGELNQEKWLERGDLYDF